MIEVDTAAYPGGIALWGAVPPVYDTTRQPLDRGIHVHARPVVGGDKAVDATYREVSLRARSADGTDGEFSVSELDAIYYMTSSVFGYPVKYVECTYCRHPHLDKDWFSVHSHRRHLCAGCGKQFRDVETAIGNPIAGIQSAIGHRPRVRQSKKKLNIRQAEFPGGLQIWGSNPAIVWTSPKHEEEGIHVHAFKHVDDKHAFHDDTYSEVTVDGIDLDADQVRTLMAQSALPHIAGRVRDVVCTYCGISHFSIGENAFTPRSTHRCMQCRRDFKSTGQLRNVIGNPFVKVVRSLTAAAVRLPQTHTLDLLPETL